MRNPFPTIREMLNLLTRVRLWMFCPCLYMRFFVAATSAMCVARAGMVGERDRYGIGIR